MKIFLGYPSEHEKAAWEVYDFLKSKGDDIWFDKVSLTAGSEWDQERDKGQREAELVIHLCSEAILNRAGVVNREMRWTRLLRQFGDLAKVDRFGFYAANCSIISAVA